MSLVPSVAGSSQAEAEAALSVAKLKVVKVIKRDGNFPAGQVLDVVPRPGTHVAAGSNVSLVVASGNVQVPDVRGMNQDMAIALLGQAGFGVGIRQTPSTVSPGTVLAQSPVNTLAPRGSDVVIDVATDPNPGEPHPDGDPTQPPSPSP